MKPTLDEEEQNQEEPSNDQENILFKNIDANVDKYAIELEKQIQKLPNPLRFIKKYMHFYFLPRLENILDELETIRQTPNYDEKVVQIAPMTNRSITPEIISCVDLLNNNNIHHPKISKMIFGTMKGNLGIYDIDIDKIVMEMNLSKQNRVDHISTSTIKYFDTYQTRIAASCRGETNIYILSYNHSFTGINTECILNTITPETTTPPQPPEKINLINIISGLKLSKDGYFLSVTDYAGGVRIFNFADIGIQSQMGAGGQIGTKSSKEDDTNKNSLDGSVQDDKNQNSKDKKNNVVVSSVPQVSSEQALKFTFVGRFQFNQTENFTILPNEAQQVDDKNKKANIKEPPKDTKKKDNKKGGKGNEEPEPEIKNPDEYNIKSEFDEEKGDNSMYQLFPENHPWIHFVQKKFIFEDNSNSEYSTSTITVGLYVAFSNSICFKFISLNEYITDKMKSIFKVKKIKNNVSMSIEDSMNLNSQMIKKEKDFLQFIRQKLDPKKSGASTIPENPELDPNLATQGNKATIDKDKDKKVVKDPKAKVDPKNANAKVDNNPQVGTKKLFSDINNSTSLLTKKEMNFTTCFNITIMNGQKVINKYNNLLGIGMIDGSVLVWDCELHTDKFLFQKNSRFEITSISIDENYLICGTIKGQIYIYDLIEGKELFTCAHDPYSVSSFQTFLSFFSFMNLGFDSNDRICIYNSKESHKIGKLIFNNDSYDKEKLNICYYNKFLCDYNDKYIVFVCEKKPKDENNKEEPKNILDLINFSKERIEILRNKPNNKTTDFYNLKTIELNSHLVKIEEAEKTNNSNISPENKNEVNPNTTNIKTTHKDDKKGKNQKNNEPPPEEEKVIEPVTRLDIRDNVVVIYRVLDVLFKCYPNLVYSQKKGMSLKKIMKKYKYDEYPTYNAADAKKEGMQSIKYLYSDLAKKDPKDAGDDLKKGLTGIKADQDEKEVKNKDTKKDKIDNSTQRKDIFFNSFKNIKERHQYKEERINKLQQQKKKIVKELKQQNNNNNKIKKK